MEQLIEAFGIDVKLITAQTINFLILLGLLSYFLYKPLLRMLAEREAKIAKGVQDAEAAEKALEEADEEKSAILAAAHQEGESAVNRAKDIAKSEAHDIVSEAERVAAEKIRKGEERGAVLAENARKESEAEVARLAVLAAAEILKREAK